MSVLVTGSRGFLGRRLLSTLSSHWGEQVHGVTTGTPSHPREHQCDLRDAGAVAELLDLLQPRHIYHLAGSYSNVFETDWANNVLAAKNILDHLANTGSDARLLVIGSAAEYGWVAPGDNPIDENHPPRPVSFYGLTKLYQTHLSQFYARARSIRVVVARVFNLCGPGASERLFVGNVERQFSAFRAGRIASIRVGNLDAFRDYLSVDEAARLLMRVLERGKSGEIYNVGSGFPIQMRELLDHLLQEVGLDWSIVQEVERRNPTGVDVDTIYADIRKLQSLQ